MKKNYKKPTLGIVNVLQEQMFCLSGFETIGTGGANRPAAVPRNYNPTDPGVNPWDEAQSREMVVDDEEEEDFEDEIV